MRLIPALLLVLALPGCAVWDAYTTASFDTNEYGLINKVRTIAQAGSCDQSAVDNLWMGALRRWQGRGLRPDPCQLHLLVGEFVELFFGPLPPLIVVDGATDDVVVRCVGVEPRSADDGEVGRFAQAQCHGGSRRRARPPGRRARPPAVRATGGT